MQVLISMIDIFTMVVNIKKNSKHTYRKLTHTNIYITTLANNNFSAFVQGFPSTPGYNNALYFTVKRYTLTTLMSHV